MQASLLAVTLPGTSFALGLGEMKVSSYLDQPFYAEIALIDIGNTPLSLIKPEFASLDTYERMGLTRSAIMSMLQIRIAKSASGKPIIQITSNEHITDPFIDVVIDLAWPQGQSYKEYTVLLDPPNYALQEKSNRMVAKPKKYNRLAESDSSSNVNVVESRVENQKTYARDTVDNAAPKVAATLPSFQENRVSELQSTLIPIVSNQKQEAPLNAFVPSIPAMQVAGKPESLQLASRESVSGVGHWANTELSVASAAVDSMRESNSVLKEQMNSLQAQNKKLQVQLDAREKELTQLRNQLDILIKSKPSVAAQVYSSSSHDSDGNGLFWFLLIVATGGAGFLFWHLKKQQPEQLQAFVAKSNDFVKRTVPQLMPKNKEILEEEASKEAPVAVEPSKESVISTKEPQVTETKPPEETPELVSSLEKDASESTVVEEIVHTDVLDTAPVEESLPESFDFHTDASPIEFEQSSKNEVTSTTAQAPLEFSFEDKEVPVHSLEEPVFISAEPLVEPVEKNKTVEESITIESPLSQTNESEHGSNTVEFETGLYKHQETTVKEPIALSEELAQSLEIQDDLRELVENNPLKSEKALDTLLDLAKTYVGMGDTDAAKHSLEEVLEYGTEAQKTQAKAILDEIG